MLIVIEEYKRRGRFDTYLEDGRWLCRSATPLLDASRKLLAEDLPPETPIAMRHKHSTTISLRSTIGAAAKLGVSNERFVPYQGGKAVGAAEDEEIETVRSPPPETNTQASPAIAGSLVT